MPAVSTKRIGPVGGLDDGVDRVAGGARQVVHDGAVLADEPVEQRATCRRWAARRWPRPRIVAARRLAVGSPSSSSASSPALAVGSSRATSSSSRSPVPRPCSALTGSGSPRPRRRNSQIVGLAAGRRRPCWRRAAPACRPRRSHVGDRGVLLGDADGGVDHEQRQRRRPRIACSLWRLTLASRSLPPGIQPPVSTSVNGHALPLGLDLLAVAGDARASPRRSPRGGRRCG